MPSSYIYRVQVLRTSEGGLYQWADFQVLRRGISTCILPHGPSVQVGYQG